MSQAKTLRELQRGIQAALDGLLQAILQELPPKNQRSAARFLDEFARAEQQKLNPVGVHILGNLARTAADSTDGLHLRSNGIEH